MSLPVLDLATVSPTGLVAALRENGAALVRDETLPAPRCAQALADAEHFFALPAAAKAALAIERSPHFRGYSVMHNERDWREQIHFGREQPASAAASASAPWRLQGPNLWPEDAGCRRRLLQWLHGVEGTGVRVLAAIARAFGFDSRPWLGDEPYLLMKLIGYHPQPLAVTRRPGVAAHLDFSLVTLTLQDDVGGLQIQRPDGTWCDVPCVRDAMLVNIGELLQYVTGNRLVATPHRVQNPSSQRRRVSIPVFVNPSLATTLVPAAPALPIAAPAGPHVHAVLRPEALPDSLPFGPAEWRRKGENVWCAACCAAAGSRSPGN